MWYIDTVGYVRAGEYKPGEYVHVPYIYHDSHMRQTFRMQLHLTESETGESAKIMHQGWKTFLKELESYNPYGWCPGGYEPGDAMFREIDKVSLDFLGYVDSVEPVETPSQDLLKSTRYLMDGFSFWDSMRSIVDCSSSFAQHAYTLFQTMCFLKDDGWVGDKFYLKSRSGKLSCVEFSDLAKARSMLSKAAVTGYNPILAHKADVPHLFRNWR